MRIMYFEVTANYTVQILPSVLQDVFYELCGLTLRTIFDLRIPGATTPIRSLLGIPGEAIATQGVGCPSINASSTIVSQGFGCADGEVLRHGAQTLPECCMCTLYLCRIFCFLVPCPKGTVYVNNSCVACSVGMYQDENGQMICKACPESTFTLHEGSQHVNQCLRMSFSLSSTQTHLFPAVCGNGMYSETGMIPCQLCPRHTFTGPPIYGGYRECDKCADGSYTAKLGSTGPSQCKLPCDAGQFSVSGLQPCSPCPINFYQPSVGQQRCIECANDTVTSRAGANTQQLCLPVECATVKCDNRAECVVINHKAECLCRPGFTVRIHLCLL